MLTDETWVIGSKVRRWFGQLLNHFFVSIKWIFLITPFLEFSKSTFIRGIKCEKSLYFYKKNFNLRDSISQSSQFIFDTGKEIGILAQGLFPEGADCTPSNHYRISESVLKTTDFIKKGEK